MATLEVTYCRICSGFCGLVVEVEDGRVVRARGDRQNPLTGGYETAAPMLDALLEAHRRHLPNFFA